MIFIWYIYIYIVKFPSSLQSLSRWLLPIIDPPLKHFGSGQPLGVGSGGILCLRPFGKARLPFISGQGPYSKRISRCWPSRADWWLWSCILGKECSGVLQILLPFTVQYIYIYLSLFQYVPFPSGYRMALGALFHNWIEVFGRNSEPPGW